MKVNLIYGQKSNISGIKNHPQLDKCVMVICTTSLLAGAATSEKPLHSQNWGRGLMGTDDRDCYRNSPRSIGISFLVGVAWGFCRQCFL